MSERHRLGKFIDITIKNAKLVDGRLTDAIRIEFDGDAAELPLGPSVTVTSHVPDHWPPQAGDLWGSDYSLHFVTVGDDGEDLPITSLSGDGADYAELLSEPGLRLIHRMTDTRDAKQDGDNDE